MQLMPWEIARKRREEQARGPTASPNMVTFGDPRPLPQPSPQTGAQATLDQYQAQAGAYSPAKAAAETQRAQAEAEFARRKAQADAMKAEADAKTAQMQSAGNGMTAETRGKLQGQLSGASNLEQRLQEVQQRFQRDFSGKGLAGLPEYLPGSLRPSNQEFNDAGKALIGDLAAAYGLTAQQQNTPTELELRFGPFIPKATDRDEVIAAKLERLRQVANQQRTQAEQQLGIHRDNQQVPGAMPGQGGQPPSWPRGPLDPSGTGYIGAQGAPDPYQNKFQGVPDEARARFNAFMGTIGKGQYSDDQLGTLLSNKYSEVTGRPLLNAGEIAKVFNKTGQFSTDVQYKPSGALDAQFQKDKSKQALIDAQNISDVRGGKPNEGLDAALRGGANSWTWGLADKAVAGGQALLGSGDYENNLAKLQAIGQYDDKHHFLAKLSGSALGLVGNEAGIARGLGAAGRAAPRFGAMAARVPQGARPILNDASYGAIYNAMNSDGSMGDRASAALTGAGSATVGGVAGRAVGRGLGNIATGVRDVGVQTLANRGVPMTLGQMVSQSGRVGRMAKSVEDKLMSIPVLGDAIKARRAEGVDAFIHETFTQALEPIASTTNGQLGEQGVEAARNAVAGAYDSALKGVRVSFADPVFARNLSRVIGQGQRLHPEVAGDFEKIVQTELAPVIAKGDLTGDEFQALRQVLRQERADWAGKPRGRQYGNVLKQVENTLESLVRRQDPAAVPALNRADAAYRRTKVVEDAVARGANTGGKFTAAQLGMAAKASGKKYGNSAATTQRPFFDLQRAAQDILPSQIPNSGTVDRAAMGALLPVALGGGGYALGMNPEHVGAMAALGLPFTKAGQAAFQKLLVERPEVVRNAGKYILRRQGLFGGAGAAGGLMLPGQ